LVEIPFENNQISPGALTACVKNEGENAFIVDFSLFFKFLMMRGGGFFGLLLQSFQMPKFEAWNACNMTS
jgi:hypothetical protein